MSFSVAESLKHRPMIRGSLKTGGLHGGRKYDAIALSANVQSQPTSS